MKPNFALAQQPLQSIFISKKRYNLSVDTSIVLLGTLLIAVAAQIDIPLQPISMSLIDIAAFFCAMAFGPRLASLMIICYYALGVLGAPIFGNEQSGIKVMTGFNLGYYIGLVPSAMLAGYLVEYGWGRHLLTSFLAAAIGISLFLFCGAVVIAMHHGWCFAWTYGISPFIEMSLLKIISLSAVIPHIWNAVSEKGEK